jgi:hypothetical protein
MINVSASSTALTLKKNSVDKHYVGSASQKKETDNVSLTAQMIS